MLWPERGQQWLWACCALVLVASVVLSAAPGYGAGVGRLRGVVQKDGQGFANQRIMLIRFGPNNDVQRFPGQTDADGRFLFENLDTGSTFSYVVGVRYQEQLYRSNAVTVSGEEPVEVTLTVESASAATAPPSPPTPERGGTASPPEHGQTASLRIMNHLMLVLGVDTHLEVREIVRLVNPEKAPARTAGGAWHIPLPRGHYNLSAVQGLPPEAVRVDGTGISAAAPLPPGEHQLVYTYRLPWPTELQILVVERVLPTAALEVLVDEERLHSTSDMPFGGPVTLEPHKFAHFRGANLEPGSRSWLQILPRRPAFSLISMGAYGLVIGLALVGGLWPFRHVWHQPGTPSQTGPGQDATPQDLRRTGRQLLQNMARLDDDYAQGRVNATLYQARRHTYKAQIVTLVERSHTLSGQAR